MGTVRRRRG